MATEKRLIDANAFECVCVNGKSDDFCNGVLYVLDMIDAQPTVNVREVVHGRWIEEYVYDPDPHDRLRYKCSVCGRTEEYREPYCNCGAKMDCDGNED